MKKLFSLIFAISLTLSACGTAQTQAVMPAQTSTPMLTQTAIQTPISTTTLIPSTFSPLFPTITPNATAIHIAQQLGAYSATLSPNENWAAASYIGKLIVAQVNGDKEFEVSCEYFTVCELIVPIAWSPDSKFLYFASLVTGEKLIPFDLYTGIGRFNTQDQKLVKVVEDSSSDLEYNASLSPNGIYFVYTETSESTPLVTVLDARTLDKILTNQIDDGLFAGNILWTNSSEEVVFISIINCESSIYHLELKTNSLNKLVDKDPSCIKLLFEDEKHQIALSKSNYYPYSKSYWYFDLFTKEFTRVISTP